MNKDTTMLQLFQEFDEATRSMEELKTAMEALKRTPDWEIVSYTADNNNLIIGEVYTVKSAGTYKIKSKGSGKASYVVRDGKELSVLYEGEFDDTSESEEIHLTIGDVIYFHSSADVDCTETIYLEQQNTLFESVAEKLVECDRQFDYLNARIDNLLNVAGVDEVTQRIEQVFQSVSDGKSLLADAITDKGIITSPEDTFAKMSANIKAITSEDGMHGIDTSSFTARPEDIVEGKTAGVKNEAVIGTMPVLVPSAFTSSVADVMPIEATEKGQIDAKELMYGMRSIGENGIEVVNYLYLRFVDIVNDKLVKACTGNVEWVRANISDIFQLLQITAEKIRYNEKIGDITGTFTEDGTVDSSKMLENEVGYSKGKRYVGSIKDNTKVTDYNVTPVMNDSANEMEFNIPSDGYYNINNKLKASYNTPAIP